MTMAMKNVVIRLLFLIPVAGLLPLQHSCNEKAGAKEHPEQVAALAEPVSLSDEFKQYWYAGKAELCSYDLMQARYGEIHEGSAVTIFVTEDFSKSKQVKLDNPQTAGNDKLPVLKLNLIKKFNTGIYSYSIMMSVFSPVDIDNYPDAVKVTANVQEWCGMSFMQLNKRESAFEVNSYSYFEKEGDQSATFKSCIPEDQLWNLIRLSPGRLPLGKQQLLPGSLYTRLTHLPLSVQAAVLTLQDEGTVSIYTIDYTTQKHTITIRFEKSFPHKILGWEETFPGFDGKLLTTTATLNKTLMSDYWAHHNNSDRVMREQLGLSPDL
jgi:hypothetical protein